MVDYNSETTCCDFSQLGGAEKSFEQQDATSVMLLTQAHGGIELQEGESIGFRQCGQDAKQAVTIGIGLDDGEYLRVRRAFPNLAHIGAKRA